MKKIVALGLSGLYLFGLLTVKPLSLSNSVQAQVVTSPISAPTPTPTPIPAPITLYIRGTIRLVSSPLSGIKVQLFSGSPKLRLIGETYSDSLGNYQLANVRSGQYEVKVSDPRYNFSPIRYIINIVDSSVNNLDFRAKIK